MTMPATKVANQVDMLNLPTIISPFFQVSHVPLRSGVKFSSVPPTTQPHIICKQRVGAPGSIRKTAAEDNTMLNSLQDHTPEQLRDLAGVLLPTSSEAFDGEKREQFGSMHFERRSEGDY